MLLGPEEARNDKESIQQRVSRSMLAGGGEAARYRSILDSQTELVCRWSCDGAILFANAAYCRFYGHRPDALLGTRWHPEVGTDDGAVILAQIDRLSVAHPLACAERRVRAADGGLVWMRHIYCGVFDAAGTLVEIQCVAHDVDAHKQIEEALHEAQELLEFRVAERTRELRHLAAQIALSEERERRMIADDLHDDLGQILHVMTLKIEALKTSADATCPKLGELESLLARASRHVRSLTSQLGSRIVDEFGLCNALRWLCDEMERVYGLRVAAQIDALPSPVSRAIGALLFRGIRELLINVTRHADTGNAALWVRSNGKFIRVVVEDGGRGGVRPTSASRGFGLASLRERLLALGGVLRIDSERRAGFRVEFLVPVDDPQVAESDGGVV